MKLLKEAHKLMTTTHYALVIIDSVSTLFRTEYIGNGERYSRDKALCEFFGELRKLMDIFGVAVVITNQVEPRPHAIFIQDKAWGQELISHNVTTRVWLQKGVKNSRCVKVEKSPDMPQDECIFYIGGEGIMDDKTTFSELNETNQNQ